MRRSYKARPIAPGKIVIQMFGTELHIENKFSEPALGTIRRTENDADSVNAVMLDRESAAYCSDSSELHITADFMPGKNRTVKIIYSDVLSENSLDDSAGYRLKVATRRTLSEFRDNYISRSGVLSAFAARARRYVNEH